MFQGATQLNLDNKTKFAMPVRYREFLLAYRAEVLVLSADVFLLQYPQVAHLKLSVTSMSLARFGR